MTPRIPQEFDDIPFAALVPGSVHTGRYPVTTELVAAYDRLTGSGPARADGVAPSSVFSTFDPVYRAMGGRMEQGSVHVGQRILPFADARVGDVLDVTVTVAEAAYVRDRPTVVLEVDYRRGDELVARTRSTILWGFSS
ncbi:hypothetical protein EV383_5827 [Pseudonocardia sediminis]|uniref:MaoC dehydratase-like protein n=1 Tax=Pseudonocardia sediminis TaxID=1397368 RepID=A0A4Q7V5U6_PSEST|nr:hypothetical protein [Pseudonocardia sediminis]RZT88874.1 hypothetical protein EV383_5827 [Pseudonocardia sediminis]